MDASKVVIIFSGYNDRAVISFVRTLENNKIEYVIIARNEKDLILKTDYKDKVILTRESQNLSLVDVKKYIEIVRKKYNAKWYFIAPSTEALNRFLLIERTTLEKLNVIVPLCDADVYVSVSDKKSFSDICREYGIFVPDEYASMENVNFPYVAKPREYLSRDGSHFTPFLIFNEKQEESFLEVCNPSDFYFQAYIKGKSIYLLYYIHRNGELFKFSQENLIQQPDGKSIIAATSSDFHNAHESIKFAQLFRKLSFHGLVMVELKVVGDKSYMIEANPRFWGPSQLFVDAGMNFFEALLNDYDLVRDPPTFHESIIPKYFWFGGFQETLRENKKNIFHVGREKDFLNDLDAWIENDVYNRADTTNVFKEG